MMNRVRNFLIVLCFIAALAAFGFWSVIPSRFAFANSAQQFLASMFFSDSTTPDILLQKYANASKIGQDGKSGPKVKVLIVPGHDDQYSGTEFRGVREADMTAQLGEQLATLLAKDPALDVTLSRTPGGYNPIFLDYFASERQQVRQFMSDQTQEMNTLVEAGSVQTVVNVYHNTAGNEVAYRLYAINKWANENKVDLVIHIHFNDNPRKNLSKPGLHSGFAIYVPEAQYSNAKASRAVAESVFSELASQVPVSDLPEESSGIVPEQQLIAIGSHNSLDAAGMLIEYGYIYEPQFLTASKRAASIANLASLTSDGVEHFFDPASQP